MKGLLVIIASGAMLVAWGAGVSADSLAQTAEDVERTMDRFLDEGGVLMSHLDRNFKPYVGDDPPGCESILLPGANCTKGEFRTYENSGMTQGAFLAAMCAKWRATGSATALEKAARTYRGIRKIYNLSQQGGRGFYCKPWGMRYQPETSSDQYVYTLAGLAAYEGIAADPAVRAEIRQMIVAMCAWWREKNYNYVYYTLPLRWQPCRFVSFAALGARFEAGTAARDELRRLLADPHVTNDVPFRATVAMGRRRLPDGTELFTVNGEQAMSGYLSVGWALEDDPECVYARRMLPLFHEQAVVSLAGDGTCRAFVMRKPNGDYVEMDPAQTVIRRPSGAPPWNWFFFGVCGPYRRGGQCSATSVNALVQMAPFHPPAAAWVAAHLREELAHIAQGHFTWYEDPFHVLPPPLRWMTDVRSGDAVANWLWAYWTQAARERHDRNMLTKGVQTK